MRSKNNRLLMLLVGAVISGCAGQTERSSSGGGAQAQTERRETPAAAAEQAPAPAPPPAPAYDPEKESVQYIDRPLDETPPPKPVVVAAAPKDEAPAEFPVTKYELPEDEAADEEVEDLGAQEDESVSTGQEATVAAESSVGETTEYADSDDEEEVEDIGTQEDESVSAEQEAAGPAESSVGEPTEYADSEEEEVEDIGTQEDESVSAQQEPAPAAASPVGEPTEYTDSDQAEEVADLGTQPDESGTISYPEEKRASAGKVVGDPKVYPDEPAKAAPPKSITVNFETEPLFNFDKAAIRADQSAKLDELISGLSGTRYDSISVVGHADRIGKDAYNQKLSERRAAAVKAYLVKKGVPADKILTQGRGESEPVTADACNNVRGKALISCLQPDRRVDVSVTATKR